MYHIVDIERMNSVIPYHRGVILQRGRGIGGVFSSLFRTLLPIGKAVIKSTPKVINRMAKSNIGKQLKKSAKRIAIDTTKDLIRTRDINKAINKTVHDSKKEINNVLSASKTQRKRKSNNIKNCKAGKYHFVQ